MKIEQLYTTCLAQAAYYIESNGEAILIDPLREIQPYLDLLKEQGTKLKYILETHFHADFVSGHLALAKATGAEIVYGPEAKTDFDTKLVKDGSVLTVGDLSIKVLHTPGHTLESTCYLLMNEALKPTAIFTGDTLFIGDVGRPDLAVKSDLTTADLATMLYRSLREKIMPLPDDVIVYPGHGPGSACGKNMSDETFDTLGRQKISNYALQTDLTEADFVEQATSNLNPPPYYFPENVKLNKQGANATESIMEQTVQALDTVTFQKHMKQDTLIIDTRSAEAFKNSFIPGAWFIGIDGSFAPWIGTLITDIKRPLLIVAEPGRETEVITRLGRIGYDNVIGYLSNGMQTWTNAKLPVNKIETTTADALIKANTDFSKVIDVRKPTEFQAEHVTSASNLPLNTLIEHSNVSLNKDNAYYIHCLGGYRSVIAISILKSYGYEQLIDIEDGIRAMKESNIPCTEFVCPSTL